MNRRLLIYGAMGLVLLLLLSEEPQDESNPFEFSVRTRAFFQTECMKEIIGFDSAARAKIRYCECVVTAFSEKLKGDASLGEQWSTALSEYEVFSGNVRTRSRALASQPNHFTSGHLRLDEMLKPARLKFVFLEMASTWEGLNKSVDAHWKQSMNSCARP